MLHELERLRRGAASSACSTRPTASSTCSGGSASRTIRPTGATPAPTLARRRSRTTTGACDAVVGRALEYADDQTLVDRPQRPRLQQLPARRAPEHLAPRQRPARARDRASQPGEEAGDFLRRVDWERTQAYALGLGGIYLNLKGREGQGIVEPDEADGAEGGHRRGPERPARPGQRRRVAVRERAAARASSTPAPTPASRPTWSSTSPRATASPGASSLGGVPAGHFEDNVKKWGGDHIIDPALVPGVLFMNRPFRGEGARLRRPGPHDPRRPRRAQGSRHGREFAAAMKILVVGLDCAAPELLFGDERLDELPPPDGRRLLRPAGERHPADHRAGLDVHGDQPGPRLARRLRLPQPRRPLLRRARDRQLAVDQRAGHLGPGRPRGQARRSSSASRPAIPPRKVNGVSRRLLPDARHRRRTCTRIPPSVRPRDRAARRRLPRRRQGLPHRRQGLAHATRSTR